jgi:hypothetical protein
MVHFGLTRCFIRGIIDCMFSLQTLLVINTLCRSFLPVPFDLLKNVRDIYIVFGTVALPRSRRNNKLTPRLAVLPVAPPSFNLRRPPWRNSGHSYIRVVSKVRANRHTTVRSVLSMLYDLWS